MKFEVGKKYISKNSISPVTCLAVTSSGHGLGEHEVGDPQIMRQDSRIHTWSEYVEPSLAVGDIVKWETQVSNSIIKAIDNEQAWITNLNTGISYIVNLYNLKRI